MTSVQQCSSFWKGQPATKRRNPETVAGSLPSPKASRLTSPNRLAHLWVHVENDQPATLAYVDSIRVEGSSESYLRFVAEAVNSPAVLSRVTTNATDEEISASLSRDLSVAYQANSESRLRGVIRSAHNVQLTSYVDVVMKLLATTSGPGAATALLALGLMRGDSYVEQSMKGLLDNAHLQRILLEGIRTQNIDCVARALALLIARRPDSIPNPPLQWTHVMAQMPELVLHLESALGELVDPSDATFEVLADCGARDANFCVLTAELLTRWLDEGKPTGILPEALLGKIGTFSASLLPGDIPRLLREVATNDRFWDLLLGSDFLTITWPLIPHLVGLGGDISASALEVLHNHLLRATERDWAHAIAGPTEWSEAAAFHSRYVGAPGIAALLEPLRQSLSALVEAGVVAQWEHWFKLTAFLSDRDRGVLMRSVRDRLLFANPGEALASLKAGGKALLTDGDFGEKADEVCRELLPLIVEEPGGFAYLKEYGHLIAEYVRSAKEDSRGVLFDLLTKHRESNDELKAHRGTARIVDCRRVGPGRH